METTYKYSFEKECSELANLETFDPAVFNGDDQAPQSLCNVVLSLSLIFNDLGDLYYANVIVGDCKPTDSTSLKTRQWGYYCGLNLHVLRLIMSAVHELLNLIDKQREDLDHTLFRDIVKALPKDKRTDWNEVVKVALGHSSSDEKLGKLLLRIRNNVSFHYDPRAVYAGFRHHFITKRFDDRAYISRGNNVQGPRFYFADASVEGLIREIVGDQSADLAAAFLECLTECPNHLL